MFRARAADLADLRDRVLERLPEPPRTSRRSDCRSARSSAADDLTPSRFLETDWRRYRGAALRGGSPPATSLCWPAPAARRLIVSLGERFDHLRDGALAVLDAEGGRLILDPGRRHRGRDQPRGCASSARFAAAHAHLLDRPAISANGERVWVYVNVDDPALLARRSIPPIATASV